MLCVVLSIDFCSIQQLWLDQITNYKLQITHAIMINDTIALHEIMDSISNHHVTYGGSSITEVPGEKEVVGGRIAPRNPNCFVQGYAMYSPTLSPNSVDCSIALPIYCNHWCTNLSNPCPQHNPHLTASTRWKNTHHPPNPNLKAYPKNTDREHSHSPEPKTTHPSPKNPTPNSPRDWSTPTFDRAPVKLSQTGLKSTSNGFCANPTATLWILLRCRTPFPLYSRWGIPRPSFRV